MPIPLISLATPDDLIERCDLRTLQDLASDTGEEIADISTDATILGALASGAGRLKAACLVGKIYTTDQLEALAGDPAALMKDIICQAAVIKLLRRRPEKYGDEAIKSMLEELEEYLDALRKGARLFGGTDEETLDHNQENAGLPSIDGPTAITYQRLNMLPDRTKNFYPARITRLPIGR